MECASCGSSIPPTFGHAIRKNECPACGQDIMDEEDLALLDDLRACVSSAARLKDDTIERIALAFIASYDIAPKGPHKQMRQAPAPQPRQQPRLPPPAPAPPQKRMAQYEEEGEIVGEEEIEEGIIQTSDLVDPNNPISDDERERIMAERVAARYQMIPQEQATTTPDALRARVQQAAGVTRPMSDAELLNNPVLEQQRMLRLQRQEANMAAGMSPFRRSDE